MRLFDQEASFSMIWKLKGRIFKSLSSPKRISNILKVHLSMALKKDRLWGIPYSILLEPTTKCNLRCPMCARTIYPEIISTRNNMNMSFVNFKKIMDEVGDKILFLFLWNWGEPLMNPDIFDIINYAKKKNIFIILSTNAYLLDENNARKLINSGLDYLIISFDGASKESYEKYRKNSDFSRVVKNIENLIRIRKEEKTGLPLINLQFILMKHNVKEIGEIKKLAKKLGVDRLTFKKTVIMNGNLKDDLLPDEEKYRFNLYNKFSERVNKMCDRPWVHTVINCDGTVVPCCDDIKSSYCMGNALEIGVKGVVNSEKYVGFRKQVISDINKIPMCKVCPRKLNKELTLIG